MSLKNIYPEKIPKEMLEKNYIDDIILYSLGAYGPLQKAEFKAINKTTFYKYLNSLIEKGFLFPPKRKRKIAIYEITPLGQAELMKRLEKYKLDFYELIGLEKKKIQVQVSQLSSFFEKYEISDDETKIDYLSLYNNLTHDDSLSIFSEEKFFLLIHYLVLNDVKYYKKGENILTIDQFIEKFDTDAEIFLTITDVLMFIQEVVDKSRYGIKIFKLSLKNEGTFLFFGENSEIGIIFETIIKKHLRNLNYLKSLNNSEIYESDLEDIMKPIMYDLIKKYKIFDKKIEKEIFHLVEEFITDLQIDLHERPFVEFDKIGEAFSIYSPYVGLTHRFSPLSEEDEEELRDIRTTFRRIREKEPKNKLLSEASNFFYEDRQDEAIIEVNKCLKIDSKDPEALELKSRILYDMGNFERALEIFDDAQMYQTIVENSYDKLYNYFFRAEILLGLKHYDKAMNIIEKDIPLLLKENNDFSETEFFRDDYVQFQLYKLEATIQYEKGNYNEALVAINKDLDYMERFNGMDEGELIVDSYSFKSKILNKLKRFEESFNNLEKSLAFKPDNPELLFQSAELSLSIYPMKSFFYLSKALDQEPNNEKYQKLYKKLLSHYYQVRFLGDFYYNAAKEMNKLFNEHQEELTFELLNKKLRNSEVLKNMNLFEEDERIKSIGSVINMASENQAIISKNDKYIQNSNIMTIFLEKLKSSLYSILIDYNCLIILDAYRTKNWDKIPLKDLISKITNKIPDEIFEAIASSLIENLIDKELLNRSKGNLIEINKEVFDIKWPKLLNKIRNEEISKNLSLL